MKTNKSDILCPYCLVKHQPDVCTKDGQNQSIPIPYKNAVMRGVPVYPVAVIGYKSCGKTSFISSLVHSLYCFPNWLSVRPLDDKTINIIQDNYIKEFTENHRFPIGTQSFEKPLMINIGILGKNLLGKQREKSAIFVIYDTPGGTFDAVNTIVDKFALIDKIPNLLLLIDLKVRTPDNRNLYRSDLELQSHVNKITMALENLNSNASSKRKNLIVCFTKTDELWCNAKQYDLGPLSTMPPIINQDTKMIDYLKTSVVEFNELLKAKDSTIFENYPHFFSFIEKHYGGSCFIRTSSIGDAKPESTPTGTTFSGEYDPRGVLDPLLWLLSI
jgi:hypothetical protein